MIDEKTLAEDESKLKKLQHHYRAYPDLVESFAERAEIIRLARRYLALREDAVAHVVEADEYRDSFDAAADRLLEGGE